MSKSSKAGPTLPERLSADRNELLDDRGVSRGEVFSGRLHRADPDGENAASEALAAEIVRRYNAASELLAFVEEAAHLLSRMNIAGALPGVWADLADSRVNAARALLSKVRP